MSNLVADLINMIHPTSSSLILVFILMALSLAVALIMSYAIPTFRARYRFVWHAIIILLIEAYLFAVTINTQSLLVKLDPNFVIFIHSVLLVCLIWIAKITYKSSNLKFGKFLNFILIGCYFLIAAMFIFGSIATHIYG